LALDRDDSRFLDYALRAPLGMTHSAIPLAA
jgi:hypothetical protein